MYGGSGRDPLAYKDAIVLSPHKFIGGPSTPGVLVVRRELLRNRVPDVPGGGTVLFVNPLEHKYLDDPVHREEGGTPAIVESIRAGLVFQLKAAVGVEVIRAREDHFLRRAIEAWMAEPAIEILGNLDAERLSIVSFVVRAPSGRYLHHNYVVALLNDLFGIQSRGGCSCAGPYGHQLLGIDLDRSLEFEGEITKGCEGIKPGWVRINFNYFLSEAVFDYLVRAVALVAREGWRLLDDYRFDPVTGRWRHHEGPVEPPLRLSQLSYDDEWRAALSRARRSGTGVRARRVPGGGGGPARHAGAVRTVGSRSRATPRFRRSSSTCVGSTCPASASRPADRRYWAGDRPDRPDDDDLALALRLADAADAHQPGPVRVRRPAGRGQAGPDSGVRRRPGGRTSDPRPARDRAAGRRRGRRGVRRFVPARRAGIG